MRLVVPDRDRTGAVGLNYAWLPTWIGMNTALTKELDTEMGKKFVGKELTESVLDEMHQHVITILSQRFQEHGGLWQFLDALKYVTTPESPNGPSQECTAESQSGP